MVDFMFVLCVYHFWVDFEPIFENSIFWALLVPFSQLYGQKTKSAVLQQKMASNQKMQENKLALKFNFT